MKTGSTATILQYLEINRSKFLAQLFVSFDRPHCHCISFSTIFNPFNSIAKQKTGHIKQFRFTLSIRSFHSLCKFFRFHRRVPHRRFTHCPISFAVFFVSSSCATQSRAHQSFLNSISSDILSWHRLLWDVQTKGRRAACLAPGSRRPASSLHHTRPNRLLSFCKTCPRQGFNFYISSQELRNVILRASTRCCTSLLPQASESL